MWVGALDKRTVWFSLQLWSTRSWLLIMNHLASIAESSPSADPITQLGMGTSKWPGSKKSCGSHPRCNVIIILAISSLSLEQNLQASPNQSILSRIKWIYFVVLPIAMEGWFFEGLDQLNLSWYDLPVAFLHQMAFPSHLSVPSFCWQKQIMTRQDYKSLCCKKTYNDMTEKNKKIFPILWCVPTQRGWEMEEFDGKLLSCIDNRGRVGSGTRYIWL